MKKMGKFLYIFGIILALDTILYGMMSLLFMAEVYKYFILLGVDMAILGKELEYENNDNWQSNNEKEPPTNNQSRE